MLRLNLGCGKDIKPGWVNIDHVAGPGVDSVYDIGCGLPYPDDSVDEILASHVIEHLLFSERAIKECHRVLKPNGRLEIRVPYGFSPKPYHYRSFEPSYIKIFVKGSDFNDGLSLDCEPLFHLDESRVDRLNLLEWHMRKYLGRVVRLPLGKRFQIVWRLRKAGGVA